MIRPHLSRFEPSPVFNGLLLCAAVALPVCALAVRGGANGSYFALCVMALAAYLCDRGAHHGKGRDAMLPSEHKWLLAAWVVPAVSVCFTQLATLDFRARAFDVPSRFLLATLLLWLMLRLRGRDLRHVQWGLIAGALLSPVLLWISTDHGAALRPRPGFATAITFGNIGLTLGVCTLLSLGWRLTRSPLEPALKLLAGLAGVAASVLSQSRGGWLAIPVLLVLFIVTTRQSWTRKLVLLCASAGLVASLCLSSQTIQARVGTAVAEYEALVDAQAGRHQVQATSVGLRLGFWRAALDIHRAHPLTGIGSHNLKAEFLRRVEQGTLHPEAARFSHVHNDYLQSLAAYGWPGLVGRLAVYLVPLWVFLRAMKQADENRATAGRLGAAVVVSFMVFGLTETMFAITMNASFYCGLVAVLLALSQRHGDVSSMAMHGALQGFRCSTRNASIAR